MKTYRNQNIAAEKKFTRKNKKRNEIIINRMLIVFVFSVLVISILLAINGNSMFYLLHPVLPIAAIIGTGILFLCALFLFIRRRIKKYDESLSTINSFQSLIFTSILLSFTLLMRFHSMGDVPVMIAIFTAVTLLYFIYYLYQNVFFNIALFTFIGGLLIYLSKTTMFNGVVSIIFRIVTILFSLCIVFFVFYSKKTNSKPSILTKFPLFNEKLSLLPSLILSILLTAGVIVTFFNPAYIIYVLAVLLLFFLITGIYYTIKMI